MPLAGRLLLCHVLHKVYATNVALSKDGATGEGGESGTDGPEGPINRRWAR